MQLYLYDTQTGRRLETVEAVSYDALSYTTPGGGRVCLGPEIEFSTLPDCSETLRADCRSDAAGVYDMLANAYRQGVQQA